MDGPYRKMTPKIFKKSNKKDMKLFFNILPDECKYITQSNELLLLNSKKPVFLDDELTWSFYYNTGIICDDFFIIDFETDKPEEMIIKRSDYE